MIFAGGLKYGGFFSPFKKHPIKKEREITVIIKNKHFLRQ
jgi:hypothetical protein